MKVRFTRKRDRLLALFWPPKRRQRRLIQAIVDLDANASLDATARLMTDLALYGVAFFEVDHG
jgi:hypothetical protein